MEPVASKRDYYIRWQQGEFGNKLRSWAKVEDIAPYAGLVTMRHIEPSSNLTRYEIPTADIALVASDSICNYRFNESAPDAMLAIQGEIMYDHRGLNLFWSTKQTNMRQALTDNARNSQGLAAMEILKHFCDPSSYADIEALLELYPDHVIEFGCYRTFLGDIPHRNTVIWEVRKY